MAMLWECQLVLCMSAAHSPSSFFLSCGLDIWCAATGTLRIVCQNWWLPGSLLQFLLWKNYQLFTLMTWKIHPFNFNSYKLGLSLCQARSDSGTSDRAGLIEVATILPSVTSDVNPLSLVAALCDVKLHDQRAELGWLFSVYLKGDLKAFFWHKDQVAHNIFSRVSPEIASIPGKLKHLKISLSLCPQRQKWTERKHFLKAFKLEMLNSFDQKLHLSFWQRKIKGLSLQVFLYTRLKNCTFKLFWEFSVLLMQGCCFNRGFNLNFTC